MLTIKIVEPSGEEDVLEVTHIARRKCSDTPAGLPAITYWLPNDGGSVNLFEGDVYVMNENGKTIAVFHLHLLREVGEVN